MMFGNKYKDGKVLADWSTGPLYCGIGKIVDCSVVQFSANEDGIIDNVKVIRSGGDVFDREAIRVVKTFPGNVQFYHGKLRRYYFTIPIVFNEFTRLSKISKK